MQQTDYETECHQQRMQTWPPRINRQHYAPHMPQHPQVLIWREVNGVDRFVVVETHDEVITDGVRWSSEPTEAKR